MPKPEPIRVTVRDYPDKSILKPKILENMKVKMKEIEDEKGEQK